MNVFVLSGTGPGEGKDDGTTAGSGVALASAFLETPSYSGAAAVGGGSEGAEDYEDDDEWEDEDDQEDEEDGTDAAGSGARRGGGRAGRGISGPLSLEKSFRLSFASVNGVLSAIAGKPSGGSFVVDGMDGAGGNMELQGGRRVARSYTSSTGQEVGGDAAGISSLSASPDHVSLPPGSPFRQAQQSRETTISGNSLSGSAFRLTPGKGGEAGTGVAAAVEVAGGVGGSAGEGEQMSAEMSGMLQRYSEMMLRVVQVRVTQAAIDVR